MIKIYKSDTGQFVLAHDPSQTVVIDENLERAYEKMQAYLTEKHPEMLEQMAQPFIRGKGGQGGNVSRIQMGLLFFLVLLPFLWLAILHYSLGSLIDEYRVEREEVTTRAASKGGSARAAEEVGREVSRLDRDGEDRL